LVSPHPADSALPTASVNLKGGEPAAGRMRRSRALLLLALLLAPALLAGCFGERSSPVDVIPYLPLNDAEPGRATEFAFFLRSTSQFKQTLGVRQEGLPAGWGFRAEKDVLDIPGMRTGSLLVSVTPDENATYGPHAFDVLVGDTRARVTVNVKDLGREPLRAGVGAKLQYVLWADNGSVIESNEPTVAAQGGIPWARAANGTPTYTPLWAYVGGERGTPAPEPYHSAGCAEPPCYRPLIEGFDARLRDAGHGEGMVAGETLAVRVPMDKAYHLPGHEDHALYNANLNFLVRVVSVDVLTARGCTLPVCP